MEFVLSILKTLVGEGHRTASFGGILPELQYRDCPVLMCSVVT